jgi:exodeoxyribonuclease V gamma subunit
MTGLTLYTSNRLEALAEELAFKMRSPGDPFQSEIIIVQSRGMERWLSLAIARQNGIVANCDFPFPNAFFEAIFSRLFDFDPHTSPFARNTLTFRILGMLPELAGRRAAFDDLRAYLEDDERGVKTFQLAAEIADLLDQYLIFRPEMLLDWERDAQLAGADAFPWQPALWQGLTRDIRAPHRAAMWQALTDPNPTVDWSRADLPARVSLFGVSYLPPYYLQVLQALVAVAAIDIYQLNPCREYWADIASEREMEGIRRRTASADASFDPHALHLETGNRLLASMGGHGREFHRLIAEFDSPVEERFEDIVPDSLLTELQHDLLHLTSREPRHTTANRSFSDTVTDRSIQVHACHSPMREIEVLQDQLLALLGQHPDVEPRDILVMTPDIETYAPYIQAVFGAPSDERHYMPFSIADRCLASASPLVETFERLLDLRTARFTASEILALLEFDPLRAQFGLAETDLDLIADLIDRVRIRWGIDGDSKTAWHLPPVEANTWRQGLDRLTLGYAMHPEPDRLFQQLAPDDRVQGSEATIIGRLHDLIETLGALRRDLDRPRSVARWHQQLVAMLGLFFRRDECWEYDFQVLERLLAEMRHGSHTAAFEDPIDLNVVRAYLKRQLSRENYRGGFIAGGLTFGALLPMRSIPAEIICLVGMDGDRFPRLDRPRSFDRMALDPRPGDRSRRSDDRYLFLEALISARRCIYISYTGFDARDNSVIPPSVLVSELCDYLQEGFGLSTEALVTTHRLQAFSPAYFQGADRLFSYNRDHARAARQLTATVKTRPDAVLFLESALPRCPESFWTPTTEDLLEALGHPCRFLLGQRLDLQLRRSDPSDMDREAFELNALEKYREGQWLTDRMLTGMARREALDLMRARGVMPHGAAGESAARRLVDEISAFRDRIRPHIESAPRPSCAYQLPVDGYRLSGRLDNLYPEGPVFYRYSKSSSRSLLLAWIQHLVFCQLNPDDSGDGATVLICRDEVRRFRHVANSLHLIRELLDLYFQAAHVPLPIFPRASEVYARQRFEQGRPAQQALQAAYRAWEGAFKVPGDREDPYIALGFRGRNPWTEGFEALAAQLFEPLFVHSETVA